MTDVVKRSARVILLDGDELVLIKRTKPGREPYWVTVGGGVEADDESIEAALQREVFEELGGTRLPDHRRTGQRHQYPAHFRSAPGVDGLGGADRYRVQQAGTGRL
jgi:8-oxo-dGTP pyrophosphatase MutT (NUDIX family)